MTGKGEEKQQAERNRRLEEAIERQVERGKSGGGVPVKPRTPHELSEGGAKKARDEAKGKTK